MQNMSRLKDAVAALGVSDSSLRYWANSGKLPEGSVVITPGGHRRFDVAAIKEWMSNLQTKATETNEE